MSFIIAQTFPIPAGTPHWAVVVVITILAMVTILGALAYVFFPMLAKAILAAKPVKDAFDSLNVKTEANTGKIQKLAQAISPNPPTPSTASIDEIAKGNK